MKSSAPALCAVLVLFLTPRAFAGGYEYGTDNGAESVARAGATTANPSFTALYTNVAGVADTRYVDLYLTNNFNFRHLYFQRASAEGEQAWDPVEDEGIMDVGPALALHFRLTNWLTLAVGANGPAAIAGGDFPNGTVEHDETDGNGLSGATRMDMTHSMVLYIWPSIAAAFNFPSFPNLRIGVSFQPSFAFLDFESHARAPDGMDRVLGEVRIDIGVQDNFVPGGQIGFLYRVNGFERLELGLQFRFSDSIKADGEAIPYINSRTPEEAPQDAADVHFEGPQPPVVMRFGVRYAHPREGAPEDAVYAHERELFDIELDVVYEMNSFVDGYDLNLTNVWLMGTEIGDIDMFIDHSWKDTVSVRLGGSVHLLRGHLTISAGASYESNTVPESHTRVDYLGWTRVGLGLGVIARFSIIELCLSYQHIFMPDRTVPIGSGRAYTPIATAGEHTMDETLPTNEGDWEASYDFVGFSLGFRFERAGSGNRDEPSEDETDEDLDEVEPEPEPEPEPE